MGQCCSTQNDKDKSFLKFTNSENFEKSNPTNPSEQRLSTIQRAKVNKALAPEDLGSAVTRRSEDFPSKEPAIPDEEAQQAYSQVQTAKGSFIGEQDNATTPKRESRVYMRNTSILEKPPAKPVHTPHPQIAAKVDSMPNLTLLFANNTVNRLGIFVYNPINPMPVDLTSCPIFQYVESMEIYRGEWENGKRNGKGEQYYPNGAMYQGHWKNDQRHGKGRFVDPSGEMYDGEWFNDKYHKKGVYISKEGATYTGDFKDGKKQGMGKEEYADGTKYDGPFQDGHKEGHGMQTFIDRGIYVGDFKADKMNGEGSLEWPDGRKYMGQWRDDKMHGVGEFIWPDGRRYKGEYQDDQKNGQGEFHWPDTRMYQGLFKDNQMHGEGYFTSTAGQTRKGVWDYGQRVKWL